jgi:replicative DNA helicase
MQNAVSDIEPDATPATADTTAAAPVAAEPQAEREPDPLPEPEEDDGRFAHPALLSASWRRPVPTANPALDCEAAVIGSVLCRNSRYWDCSADGLRAAHFESELHGQLWDAIGALLEAGLEASPLTLQPKFAGDALLLAQGGHRYFGWLALTSAGVSDVVAYARAVREWADRRRLIQLGGWIETEALHGASDVKSICAEMEAALDSCRSFAPLNGPKRLALLAQQAQASHERARERGTVDGVPYGLKELDRLTGGAAKSDLIILAGRPGMGKSALALHIALGNAKAGRGVALFSLEMSAEQLASRAIAAASGVGADRLRSGDTSAAQLQAAQSAAGQLDMPLFIDDTGGLDMIDLRGKLRRLGAQTPLHLVVIDYLQLMRGTGRSDNRVQELTAITAELKALAKELALPIVALSQLSRAVELREDKRPLLSDLRDSGSIEQDADAVVFLYREHYYVQRQEPRDASTAAHGDWLARCNEVRETAELIIAKNRHGACDTAVVGFEGALTRFYDRQVP